MTKIALLSLLALAAFAALVASAVATLGFSVTVALPF
jgi:hypothetical protein